MSKLLKSKILLGVFALVLTVAVAGSALAADGAITKTLKKGMKDVQVKYLQQTLNEKGYSVDGTGAGSAGKETTYFGTATLAAVKSFQAAKGLVDDGIFGKLSRAALEGTSTTGGDLCPNGNTVASSCQVAPGGTASGPLCPNGMTVASNCSVAPAGTTPVPTGPISLAVNNPAPSTLVSGQSSADLLHFVVNGTGTVTNVKLMRTGVSTSATLSNVYLFDGATRLTDAATVNSLGEINFNAPSGLFTVSGTRTISVLADIAALTSGQTVGVSFVSGMMGTTALTGTAAGNLFTIASVTGISTVSFDTVTPTGATINPAPGVTLWQSTATVSNHDTYLDRLAFRQIGSAPATAFANFKLYVNGVVIATATGLDSNGYVTFVPTTPLLMTTGARVIRVDADVVSGASRTIQLSLRTAADAGFRDSQLGVNIAATTMPVVAVTASTISGASGGTMTIEKDLSSPSQNVVLNGHDVLIGVFKATAFGEPVKIETLRVGFASSDVTTASLSNGHIMIGGAQYGSSTALVTCDSNNSAACDASDTTYTSYTLNYVVTPGTPALIEVRADIDDAALTAATDSITAVVVAGSSNAIRQDSLGTFSSPALAVSANALTVQSASLALAKNTTYTTQTTVVPQTGFKLGSYNLSGSSVEDVLLSTLSFDIDEVTTNAGVTDFDENDLTNVYVVVKNGSTIVAQPSPLATLSSDGQDNDFSISYTLPKNQNVTIELFGTIGSNIADAQSMRTDLTVTGTSLVSGVAVTATNANTVGQTIIGGAGTFTATADASNPVKAVVSDNKTVTSAAFKFAAVNSSYTVTDLVFSLGDSTAVSTVQLYDGATLVASQTPSSTTVTFAGMSWLVPANSSPAKVLTVKLVLADVGYSAGTSGADITTTLTSGVAISSATGASASISESNPAGSATYQYAAVPVITMTSTGTTIGNGLKTLAAFTVASDGGYIAWNKMVFTVTKTTAATVSTAAVYDSSNTIITGPVLGDDTGCDSETSCTLTFLPNLEQQVSGSASYTLRATVGSAVVGTDSISTSVASATSSHTDPTYGFGYHSASGNIYYDADTNLTSNLNDVRQIATDKYTTAGITAATGTATGLTAAFEAKSVQSYGIPDTLTLTIAEGSTDNTLAAATYTVTGAGSAAFIAAGGVCTPYTGQNYSGAIALNSTTVDAIRSIRCTATGMDWKLTHNAAIFTVDTDGTPGTGTHSFVLTKAADYAVGSVVAATDSDAGLTLAAQVAAGASFLWSDTSAQSHSTVTADWSDDYLVKNLPLDTYTLQ